MFDIESSRALFILIFFVVLFLFIYLFILDTNPSCPSLLSLSPPTFPQPHPRLSEGMASYGKSTKSAPSPHGGRTKALTLTLFPRLSKMSLHSKQVPQNQFMH